jgi:hypothetical protein
MCTKMLEGVISLEDPEIISDLTKLARANAIADAAIEFLKDRDIGKGIIFLEEYRKYKKELHHPLFQNCIEKKYRLVCNSYGLMEYSEN